MLKARRTRLRLVMGAMATLAAVGAGILATVQPAVAVTFAPISGAGSTWSYNAIQAWIANEAETGMTVNYADVGSTTGRSQFAEGTADFAASEIPYGVRDGSSYDPPPTRGYAYMPDTAGATVFMYNLSIGTQRVTNLRLSGAVIAGIFTNTITRWNDPKIAADNPDLALPDIPIIPVVRSDGDGSTAQFTQWMLATQPAAWNAYCGVVGRNPCTQTSTYPIQPGSSMVGQAGDLGVSGYVSQAQADGAIGYTEYSYALETGFPVAKVLNAAGYYTSPTAGNVGVSLLNAQINMDQSSPMYETADLSQVYTDTDPRTYELSSYSYLIVPTDTSYGFTTDKGYTLGAFGEYLLCQGQQQVDALGYSALPINLVEAGYAQLQKIPGAQVPTVTSAFIASCNNPTFSTDGTNTLAQNDPYPHACDVQGPTQCNAAGTVNTTTTLTASPDPAQVGQTVTLTATETAQDNTSPAGSVQFEAGGTDIGSPVAVSSAGVATTTTSFAVVSTQSLSAVFTPASTTTYAPSTGTASESVQATGASSGSEPIAVSVPSSGSFTLTVAAGTVTLTVSGATATGALNPITVADTRNSYPGWSVSGQSADFTGSGTAAGSTIPGNQLGWEPTDMSLAAGVTLGSVITDGGDPGLGTTAAVLAQAHAGTGFGTSVLGANLVLAIPPATLAGAYNSSLTVTAVTALP